MESTHRGAIRSFFTYLVNSLNEDWSRNRYLYSDATDHNLFQKWLHKILDEETAAILSGSYYGSRLHKYAGLYTYRYCNLYCTKSRQLHSGRLRNINELKIWEKNNCYIDVFLQTNSLEQDLSTFIQKYSIVKNEKQIPSAGEQKMNSSKAPRKSVASFYNDDAIDLVKKRKN